MNNRLQELDILRGLSIIGMILVITPGNWGERFSWMIHASWRGYPLSDMIFPTFLFCIGISLAISFDKKLKKGSNYTSLFKKLALRTITLIAIGLFVNGFPSFEWQNFRIPGILQRIALCYFIVSMLWLALLYYNSKYPILWLLAISIFILFAYYLLLYYIPIPNIGITGDSSVNSWPVYLNQKVFGINHLFIYGTTNGKVTFDPEGILASLPSCANVLLGLIIGVIHSKHPRLYKIKYLFLISLCLILFGFLLDQTHVMPIIKNIWTSSFALFSGGFSILILALIIFLNKIIPFNKRLFYPVIIYGSNALLAFIISNLLMNVLDRPFFKTSSARMKGYSLLQSLPINNQWASFLFTIIFLSLLFLGLQIMYKRKWFVKL